MSDYDVLDIGGLDTWGDYTGPRAGKRFIDKEIPAQYIGMSANSLEPGGTAPFWHTHSVLEEIYVFLAGRGEMLLDDEVVPVQAGTVVRVGQGVWRAYRSAADSPEPLRWLCLRAGGDELSAIPGDGELDKERPLS